MSPFFVPIGVGPPNLSAQNHPHFVPAVLSHIDDAVFKDHVLSLYTDQVVPDMGLFVQIQGFDFFGDMELGILEIQHFLRWQDIGFVILGDFFLDFAANRCYIPVGNLVFQHSAPIGFVLDELGQMQFQLAGGFSIRHFGDGDCGDGPLVHPSIESV